MHLSLTTLLITLITLLSIAMALPDLPGLDIEVTQQGKSSRKTQRGDTIDVHYRGTLKSTGKEFDASYNRGQPLSFTVGQGQVCCASGGMFGDARKG